MIEQFARNGLDRELWKLCDSRFGYQDTGPTRRISFRHSLGLVVISMAVGRYVAS